MLKKMNKRFYQEPRLSLDYVSINDLLCTSPGVGESEGTSEEPLFP